MANLKHLTWTFLKAQLSAQMASLVDFSVSLFLAEVVGLWYLHASFLGALSGGVFNCVVNYRWVFNEEELKKRNVAIKYMIVWTGSILLNTAGTYALTELSGQYFVFAKLIVAVTVGIFWNFLMQNYFVYHNIHWTNKLKRNQNKQDI